MRPGPWSLCGEVSLGCAAPPLAAAPSWVDRPMRWAQLTLVEDDPGQFDLAFWLDYFRRTHSDGVCLSAGGCVAYYPTEVPLPPPQPVPGRPRPVRRAGRGLPRSSAWSCSRGPTRTRPTTTSDEAHPDWIAVDAAGPAAPALGLARDVGHLRPGAVQLRIHDRGSPGDHDALPRRRDLHQPLGRLRHVLLRALPDELPGRDRPRAARDGRPAGPRASGVHRLAPATPLRAVAALGRGGPQDQPRLLRDPQRRRRRDQPARHEDHRRAGPDPVRRPAGAERADAPVGQRQEPPRSTAP